MIHIENISHSFGDVRSLENVTTDIKDGSIYGLIGSNGSGKSTLLRIMCGVYRPEAGGIYYDGVEVFEEPDTKSGVIYIPDEPYFLANSTLLSMADFYSGIYRTFDRQRFKELTDIFGLPTERRLVGFSKGMKKQAAIILALASRPRVLLFDETFDGLDPKMRRIFCGILGEAAADGITSIVASHSLRELEDICDCIGLLSDGKLLVSCELDELREKAHKVQAVIKDRESEAFTALAPSLIGMKWSGSLATFVMKGSEAEVVKAVEAVSGDYYELIPLTLEEIFISEMEGSGYDVNRIIQ